MLAGVFLSVLFSYLSVILKYKLSQCVCLSVCFPLSGEQAGRPCGVQKVVTRFKKEKLEVFP